MVLSALLPLQFVTSFSIAGHGSETGGPSRSWKRNEASQSSADGIRETWAHGLPHLKGKFQCVGVCMGPVLSI